ncbi:MAG: sugar ABC transporter permease [Acidimicrobiia bacterium]|nr:sugar ABC transporter permease [Acidimicrobiia bacterium]
MNTTSSKAFFRRRAWLAGLALASPALLWFAVFMVGPLAFSFYASTLRWNGLLSSPMEIGVDNYARILSDPRFWRAVNNSAVQIVLGMVTVVPTAFALGFFLSRRPPGYRILTLLFFAPVISSTTAKAIMFIGLFLPEGMINTILREVGLGGLTRFWLGEPSTALGTIIALDIWAGIGFYAVLFSASLSNVPADLYEAAELDGAGPVTQMRRIALPLITDFVGVVLILHFLFLLLGSVQNVLLITQGGPGDFS